MACKALLVGVNDYQGVGDLSGCVNDVTNMRDVLKRYLGVPNSGIRVLTDDRATKKNVVDRLKWLVKGAKAGDLLLFHFSGHGSQIRDRDGDELRDHMDELICPHDMDWDGTFITDDDLRELFSGLKGALLEVFLDSCHSGTGLRNSSLGRPDALGSERPTKYRFLPPPADIACRFEGEEDDLEPMHGFKSKDRSTGGQILWAGCRDDQTSADAYIAGSYNGAFTYYFCKHIRDSGGDITRAELLRRIRASLRHNGYSQVPQLECETAPRKAKAFAGKKTG